MIKWADRIAASRTLREATKDEEIVNKIREVISSKKYKLVNDGEEFNGKKYRLVCEIDRIIMTLVVVDTKQALVFKSVWKAKAWEEKYFKGVR